MRGYHKEGPPELDPDMKKCTVDQFRRRFKGLRKRHQYQVDRIAKAINDAGGVTDENGKEFRVASYARGEFWKICLEQEVHEKVLLKPEEVIPKAWRRAADKMFQRLGIRNQVSVFKDQMRSKYRTCDNSQVYTEELVWRDVFKHYTHQLEPITSGKYIIGDEVVERASKEQKVEHPYNKDEMAEEVSDKVIADIQAGEMDMQRDAKWVYHMIGVRGVTRDQAPSPGAWNMLIYAREHKDKFFQILLPKLCKDVDGESSEMERQKEHSRDIGKMQQILEGIVKDSAEESLAKQSSDNTRDDSDT